MRALNFAIGMAAVLLVAGVAQAGVADGPHNMNNYPGIVIDQGQICVPCHAPHQAANYTYGPLWNHAMTKTSFDQGGRTDVLNHESLLCMSCHDGLTAVGNFGGITTDNHLLSGDLALWTSNGLEDDHPMGVTYPTSGHGWWSQTDNPDEWAAVQKRLADDGTVQCSSCHTAHSASTRSVANSELCLLCHNR